MIMSPGACLRRFVLSRVDDWFCWVVLDYVFFIMVNELANKSWWIVFKFGLFLLIKGNKFINNPEVWEKWAYFNLACDQTKTKLSILCFGGTRKID